MAITFDEGPSQYTANVLFALRANNIKATFHVVTDYLLVDVAVVTNL